MYIFPCVPHLANHPDFQVIWSLSYLSSVISFSPSLSQSTSISFRPCFQAPPSHLLFYMDLSLPFHSWSLPSCSVMSLLASFSVTPLTSSCNYYYKKKKKGKNVQLFEPKSAYICPARVTLDLQLHWNSWYLDPHFHQLQISEGLNPAIQHKPKMSFEEGFNRGYY